MASKDDDQRLAEAVEAYRLAMEVPDPIAVYSMLQKAKRRKTPGDPFNATIDQLVEHIFKNPDALSSSEPSDYLRSYLSIASEHIKTMVAEKVEAPSLDDPAALGVDVDDDWRINAFVEEDPPYTIYVSTNLYLFCARISELMIAGLGLNVVDDDAPEPQHVAKPAYSAEEIARNIKKVLESFARDQTIAETDVKLQAAHFTFHQIVFQSVMALIICHEFGHVVINVTRHQGKPAPFSDRAHDELQGNVDNLIRAGRHDPEDRADLRGLDPGGVQEVLARWENEITADLIGVSLAAEYSAKRGPWKDGPGILGIAYLGFHLCFIAQHMLYNYMHLHGPDFLLVSKSHPPIDFRMHCVLGWMYNRPAKLGQPAVPYGENEAFQRVTEYSQQIVNKVFGQL